MKTSLKKKERKKETEMNSAKKEKKVKQIHSFIETVEK